MIGGGEYTSFLNLQPEDLDRELLLKNTAIAALMPVVQFSLRIGRVYPEGLAKIHEILSIRKKIQADYDLLVQEARERKTPIVRYLEYVFPGQGLEEVTDQFMLGNQYLVAPQYEQGKPDRTVILPQGSWENVLTKERIEAEKVLTIRSAELLAVYKRLEA